jgi:hydrogenase-4 component E
MLVSTFLLVSRMRLPSLLALFRLQSIFLAIYAFALAYVVHEQDLVIMALLILILKAVLLPYALMETVRRSRATLRLEAYFKPTSLTFIAAATIIFSFLVTMRVFPGIGSGMFIVGTAVSLLLVGLSLLIVRGDLFGQSIGFMVMENGIFVFGLALVGSMPLFVEIGIFFDVLVSFIIMVALTYRVQHLNVSVKTKHLKELIG